jgi:hypothetical protein
MFIGLYLLLATKLAITKGQTLVSTDVTSSETWTLEASPYLISVPFQVSSYGQLTIEKDVEVRLVYSDF